MTRDYPKNPGPFKPPIPVADPDLEEGKREIEKIKQETPKTPKKDDSN